MALRLVMTGLLSLALMACSTEASTLPPPPAEASVLPPDGLHEMKLRDVVSDLRQTLESRYGEVEVHHHKLPAGTRWTSVAAYYEAEFGQAWDADEAIPELRSGYRLRVWRHRDGSQALAAGLISDPVPGSPAQFQILLIAVPHDG